MLPGPPGTTDLKTRNGQKWYLMAPGRYIVLAWVSHDVFVEAKCSPTLSFLEFSSLSTQNAVRTHASQSKLKCAGCRCFEGCPQLRLAASWVGWALAR